MEGRPSIAEVNRRRLEKGTVFYAELFCSSTESSRKVKIVFDGDKEPEFLSDVMKKVEIDFSIPVCVQDVTYEGHPMEEKDNLKEARIRHGDSFYIKYSSEGDCSKITAVSKWFRAVRRQMEKEHKSIAAGKMTQALELLIATGISGEIVEDLAFKYLFPWLDARKYANKLYFVSCGGLGEMMRIYDQIVQHPWGTCTLNVQCLEYSILRVLWNLSETFDLRRCMLSHNNCLQLCMKSLMREEILPNEDILTEEMNFSRRVLVEVIGAALGFLCKYVR